MTLINVSTLIPVHNFVHCHPNYTNSKSAVVQVSQSKQTSHRCRVYDGKLSSCRFLQTRSCLHRVSPRSAGSGQVVFLRSFLVAAVLTGLEIKGGSGSIVTQRKWTTKIAIGINNNSQTRERSAEAEWVDYHSGYIFDNSSFDV